MQLTQTGETEESSALSAQKLARLWRRKVQKKTFQAPVVLPPFVQGQEYQGRHKKKLLVASQIPSLSHTRLVQEVVLVEQLGPPVSLEVSGGNPDDLCPERPWAQQVLNPSWEGNYHGQGNCQSTEEERIELVASMFCLYARGKQPTNSPLMKKNVSIHRRKSAQDDLIAKRQIPPRQCQNLQDK